MLRVVHRQDLAGHREVRDTAINEVTIHRNTVAKSIEGVRDFYRDDMGWGAFPYTLFVDVRAMAIIQVLPVSWAGPHAKGRNSTGLGVAINLDGRQHGLAKGQEDLLVLAVRAAIAGAVEWNASLGRPDIIPRIERHHETCPGPKINMADIRRQCRAELAVPFRMRAVA